MPAASLASEVKCVELILFGESHKFINLTSDLRKIKSQVAQYGIKVAISEMQYAYTARPGSQAILDAIDVVHAREHRHQARTFCLTDFIVAFAEQTNFHSLIRMQQSELMPGHLCPVPRLGF